MGFDKSSKDLHEAITRLASVIPYGALLADTDPVAFLDEVRRTIEELRKQKETIDG